MVIYLNDTDTLNTESEYSPMKIPNRLVDFHEVEIGTFYSLHEEQ